jgi:hypothetical protein
MASRAIVGRRKSLCRRVVGALGRLNDVHAGCMNLPPTTSKSGRLLRIGVFWYLGMGLAQVADSRKALHAGCLFGVRRQHG